MILASLALLSTFVVIGLSSPLADHHEYKIPQVGTGRRSQYYVLHSDGTFKYGFDSGDGAFESVKSKNVGERNGNFGYVDPEGRTIRLEYESGVGGFVARGDHLPKPSPELAQALAAVVKRTQPFVDPLAGGDSDRSYGFRFQSEDHSRNEQSDSDGTITGSYSYVDENGVRRSFTYRAGKGIGFVIEGDGLTQDVAKVTTTAKRPSFRTPQKVNTHHSSIRTQQINRSPKPHLSSPHRRPIVQSTSHLSSGVIKQELQKPSRPSNFRSQIRTQTQYTPPRKTQSHSLKTTGSSSAAFRKSHQGSHSSSGVSQTQQHILPQSHITTPFHQLPKPRVTQRQHEEANNLRTSFSPDGSYSFSYDSSGHSRSETGNDGNVDGKFHFTSDDDDVQRHLTYEAGRDTGFIAEGDHLPKGPVVPGSPSGQPTGRLVRVFSEPFVDPLADSDTDASYKFGFNSDTYSRSETADEDGNVVGTYTIVEEDGTRVTYKFRAGKGIGFETQEVSRTKGPRPVKPVPYKGPLAGAEQISTSGQSSFRVGQTNNQATFRQGQRHQTTLTHGQTGHRTTHQQKLSGNQASFRHGQTGHQTTHQQKLSGNQASFKRGQTGYQPLKTSFGSGHQSTQLSGLRSHGGSTFSTTRHHQVRPQVRSNVHSVKPSHKHTATTQRYNRPTGTKISAKPTPFLRSSLKPSHSEQVFPGFVLHRYEPALDAQKFGYVLKFD